MRRCFLKFHFLLLSLVAVARLDAQPCTAYLAGLSAGDEKAAEIATKTFADLIDTVNNPAAKAAWIATMAARQDPFALPPENADLLVPLKHLEAFRGMLERVGYTPPAMQQLLLPVVAQLRADNEKAKQEQTNTLRENFSTITITTPELRNYSISPDRRYLSSQHEGKFWVVDGEKAQIFEGPEAPNGSQLRFSSDNETAYVGFGKELTIYHRKGQKFTQDRKVSIRQSWWEKRITGREKTFAFGQPVPIANPRWVLTELRYGGLIANSRPGVWLIDVATGEAKRVNGTHEVQSLSGHGSYGVTWNVVPGTNRLFISIANGDRFGGRKVLYGDIDENGLVKQWHPTGLITRYDLAQPNLWVNQDYLAVRHNQEDRSIYLQALKGGPPHLFTDEKGYKPSSFHFHPDGKTAFANFQGRLQQIDLETRRVTATFEAPLDSWLSPDGERLYSIVDGSKFQNAPYKSRLKAEPPPP